MTTGLGARKIWAGVEHTPAARTSAVARATIEAGAVVLLVDGDLEGARDLYAPLGDRAGDDDRLAPLWDAVSRLASLAGAGLHEDPETAAEWSTLRIMGEDLATLHLRTGSYDKAAQAYQRLVLEHPFDRELSRTLDDIETVMSYLDRLGLVQACVQAEQSGQGVFESDETTWSRTHDLELEPTSERPHAEPPASLGLDHAPTVVEHRGRIAESHLTRWFQRRASELCACFS